jgi:hypothetical protein
MADDPEYSISELVSGIVFNQIPLTVTTGSITLSIETDFAVSASITAVASSTIDITSEVSAQAFAIKTAVASLSSILDISVASPSLILDIDMPNLSGSVNLSISDIINFTPSTRYPGSYVPLLLLDGVALTAQNRKFNDSLKTIFVEQKNWNNDKSRYYRRSNSGKKSFKLSWEWLPSDREYTIDKREARNYIKNISMDPDVHTLTLLSYGDDPEDIFEETNYNIFITSYSEELIRRDLTTGTYFWQCSLDMEEL